MTDSPKTVRMIGPSTTEWNHSQFGIFRPRDDGSFAIPEAAVPDALKAGLVVAEVVWFRREPVIPDRDSRRRSRD